jgi:hypothetical protein
MRILEAVIDDYLADNRKKPTGHGLIEYMASHGYVWNRRSALRVLFDATGQHHNPQEFSNAFQEVRASIGLS